jgi:hypothetical protein
VECENCGADVLLENLWCRAIFRTQFALLLFLRDLISSILSLVTGLSFVEKFLCKKPLLKNPLAVIYCGCFQTFAGRENFVGKDADKFLACSSVFAFLISELNIVRSLKYM